MLETRDLTIGYAGHTVLDRLDLRLEPEALTVLIGANGSGKSTLLRTLCGTQPALGGEVLLDGQPVGSYTPARMARRMALVLTDRRGGGGLRVRELVAIGRHPYSGFLGRLSRTDRAVIDDALHAVGLDRKADDFVASLSDGERQKAMIARAVAQDTPLIVLDEPTAFLDVSARFEVMGLLADQCRKHGKTILLSSHDIAPSLAVAQRLWAVTGGTVAAGTPAALAADGTMDRIYTGVRFNPARSDYESL